jgi:hypothetical protein
MQKYMTLIALLFLTSCSMDKVSKITIKNNNNTTAELVITALNKSYTAQVAPNSTYSGQFIWTGIEEKDGTYELDLRTQGGSYHFSSSYFYHGELANYLNYEITGNQIIADVNN